MPRNYKVIMIGDGNVGKSCLLHRFCKETYCILPVTILTDFFEKDIIVDDVPMSLTISDGNIKELDHLNVLTNFYRKADAIVYVYDVNNIGSFFKLRHWFYESKQHNLENWNNIPKVLVGTKVDCLENVPNIEEVAQRFADDHNMAFYRISAKESDQSHINAVFMVLANGLKSRKSFFYNW